MSAPLSPIIEGVDSGSSYRPKTFQPPDASSKNKNRKSRIRYTGAGESPWTHSTLNQPLPSKAAQQVARHMPKTLESMHGPTQTSEVQRSSRKAHKHPDSLLISRPSFLGDFQTLAAYYQSERKSDHQLQTRVPSPPTRTSNVRVLPPVTEESLEPVSSPPKCKLPALPNPNPPLPPKPNMKGVTTLQGVSRPGTESRQESESHGYTKIKTPQRATRADQMNFKGEDSESMSSDLDHLPDSPPQLDLPFFGAGRHIGCRFSVRTLTREVERGLKSLEPASRKTGRKSKASRIHSVHNNFKILNRTRKDLGMRPRHDIEEIDSSGHVKPVHDFDDVRSFQKYGIEGPDGEACGTEDSDLGWSDVERLFARLPTSIEWEERRQDNYTELESPSSFMSPSSEASSIPGCKGSASPERSYSLRESKGSQHSALLHSVVSTKSETCGSFHPPPGKTKIMSPSKTFTELQGPPKTPRKIQLTPSLTSTPSLMGASRKSAREEEGNSICSKALPALVPQPWGRARGQNRNTIRYAPAPLQSPASRFSCATTTQMNHQETRKHLTISAPTSAVGKHAQFPHQAVRRPLPTTSNVQPALSTLKPVLKPLQIPGIGSPLNRHPSGTNSTTGLMN
ncbi:hypothetical protein CROQUDRAFT_717936 [Cronartium quercuum f. sp. fusiforme G11]|uniref:Uncharacterized protein n=1 Tax=Cronartium quercuum f. sp. fusiforme G11 TaxID=708437 RepID=A0A9P6NDC5_9BASI|nr:hypothetical protein CROQUDRAFT_717936 [Cronartium quercuum f. sp. fusiforme G11]